MRIIDRYIAKQILTTVIWAIGVLSMLLVVGNAMRDLLTILVNRQLPLSYVFSFIAYALPFSMTFSIPWGVLVSILLIFGKLSSDNELVALRANGVSIVRICFPVFVIAVAFFGICLWINLYLSPESQVKLKQAIFNLASEDPLALFGSDQVIDDFPNRKIYVGKKEGSALKDLHIYELNGYQVPIRVIYARKGTLEVDKENERILLRIFDARYEERDERDPDNLKKMRYGITMREGVLPISLNDLISKASNNQRPNLLTLDQLRDALEQQTGRIASAYRTEVSKRFSNAMAVLTFVLVGIPLAITAQRRETSVGLALSLVVAFTYFIFIVITDNVKNNPHLHPELLIWLPNLLYLTLGTTLFTRLARR